VIENVERVIEEEPELSTPEATKKGDGGDHRPIIAITLVLLSVFVPVLSFPGSVVSCSGSSPRVSASNDHLRDQRLRSAGAVLGIAETRADCARPMRYVLRGIDGVRDGYVSVVRRLVRVRCSAWGGGPPSGPGRWGCSGSPRRASCRPRIRAPSCAAMRLPEAPRINRTKSWSRRSKTSSADPWRAGVISVVGFNFIDYLAASNQAFFVVRMKPYEERTDPSQSVDAVIARLRPQLGAISGRSSCFRSTCPDHRLGSTAASNNALEGLQGQSPNDIAAVMRALLVAPSAAGTGGVFSTLRRRHAADPPRHRTTATKAQVLASRSATSSRAQSTLGGFLQSTTSTCSAVPGRSMSSRGAVPRQGRGHLSRLCARQQRSDGADPALAQARLVQAPQALIRYNGYRGAIINGATKPATAPARGWRR